MRQNEYNISMPRPPKLDLADLFNALGNPLRLRLINLMLPGEICVCHLVEILHEPQPKISQHLAALRAAGLVLARREGKWMHYQLATPAHDAAASILHSTLEHLRHDARFTAERRKIKNCCEPLSSIQPAARRKSS